MNITVVGAGAIGGFLGGMLSLQGHNVSFIARGEHLSQMQKKGLTLIHDRKQEVITGHFTDALDAVSEAELILFTVKSTETERTALDMLPYVNKDCFILTFQNGVSNEEVLTNIFHEDQVFAGAAYISAQVDAPGIVQSKGQHIFYVGGISATNEDKIKDIVTMFSDADIRTKFSERIMERKWEKSLWNVTFNPLSAVSGATVGEILDTAELHKTSRGILEEISQIVNKLNINIRESAMDRVFESAELVRLHKTSMLQDKEKGKPMEVEALCGYFVKKSRKMNLKTPILDTLYSLLLFNEQQRAGQ